MQKMADQERSDIYVVFTINLSAPKSLEMLKTLLSEIMVVKNQKLVAEAHN